MSRFVWAPGDLELVEEVEKYDPEQPRAPAGSSAGGEWVSSKVTPFGTFSSEAVPGGTAPPDAVAAAAGRAVAMGWRTKAGKPGLNGNQDRAAYYFGHRLLREDSSVQQEHFALVGKVVAATKAAGGTEAEAMEVLGSMEQWNTDHEGALLEYAGAIALGANTVRPKGQPDLPTLTPGQIAAFRARQEATADYLRRTGTDLTAYRGVRGPQGKKVIAATTPLTLSEHLQGNTYKKPVELGLRTLSSWSLDRRSATLFATNYGRAKTGGPVLKTVAKPNEVWLMTGYGPRSPLRFSEDHGEIVLFTPATSRTVERVF